MIAAKERKSRLLGAGEIDVSFEFFPPKTPEGEKKRTSGSRLKICASSKNKEQMG